MKQSVVIAFFMVGVCMQCRSAGLYTAFGDSITLGSLASNNLGYVNLIASDNSLTATNYAVAGYGAADVGTVEVFRHENPTDTDSTLYTLMVGVNEAWFSGSGAYEPIFNNLHQAILSWMSISSSYKTAASSGSTTGTWIPDANLIGTWTNLAMQSTTVNSTLSMSLVTYGGPIYLWYLSRNLTAGVFTWQLNGGAATTVNVTTSPAITSPANAGAGVSLVRIPSSAGTNTVLITVTSSTDNGHVVAILGIGTPRPAQYLTNGYPKLYVGGVIKNLNDTNSANTLAYDTDIRTNVAFLQSDGLPVYFVDVRSYLNATTDIDNSDGLGLHPSNIGHSHLRNAFESIAFPFPSISTSILRVGTIQRSQ